MMNPSQQSMVLRALRELYGAVGDSSWNIQRVASGGQAVMYRVGRPREAGESNEATELVVKIFDPSKPQVDLAARDEFDSLAVLHAAIDQMVVDEWTIRVPRPVHLLRVNSEAATCNMLFMTPVSGTPLASLMRRSEWSHEPLLEKPLARTLLSVLDRYWSASGRIYGDMNFRNILCDPATRTLSFIDCGIPEDTWHCCDVRRHWYPASRDLAYLLFSAAIEWKRTIGHPEARQRELRLAHATLAEFLDRIEVPTRRENALDEMMSCADQHLARIRRSWSLQGIWRTLVKRVAEQSMDEVFADLQRHTAREIESKLCCTGPAE